MYVVPEVADATETLEVEEGAEEYAAVLEASSKASPEVTSSERGSPEIGDVWWPREIS